MDSAVSYAKPARIPESLFDLDDADGSDPILATEPIPRSLAVGPNAMTATLFTTTVLGASPDDAKLDALFTVLSAASAIPRVTVVVFTRDERLVDALASVATQLPALMVSSEFECNKFGTPTLRSMFATVERLFSSSTFVGYLNADIFFDPDAFWPTLKAVQAAVTSHKLHARMLLVGRRTNIRFHGRHSTRALLPTRDSAFAAPLQYHALAHSKLFLHDAQDYFLTTPGSFDWASEFPDVVVGRPGYDNWIVHFANHHRVSTVDVSKSLVAFHLTGPEGTYAGHGSRVDKDWNIDLIAFHFPHGRLTDCRFETRALASDQVEIVDRKKSFAPTRPGSGARAVTGVRPAKYFPGG